MLPLPPDQRARFDEFYGPYPVKKAKLDAMKAWAQVEALEPELLTLCLAALPWQMRSQQWRLGYIPYPATYLRAGRFYDEPTAAERVSDTHESRHDAAMQQAMEYARKKHGLTQIQ